MDVNGDYLYMKECPHCGEKNLLSVQQNFETEHYYGRCEMCLSRGPIAGSVKAACQRWNDRPKQKEHKCSCGSMVDMPLMPNNETVPFNAPF